MVGSRYLEQAQVRPYHDSIVLETLLEGLEDRLLMLLLDNGRSSGEDSEGIFSLFGLRGLAELEEGTEQFGPGITCEGGLALMVGDPAGNSNNCIEKRA